MLPGSGLRQPSQPSSALTTRIAAKKAELENLRQLRDLSGTLAMQMQALESKIATLKDGTEGGFLKPLPATARLLICCLAVACVLANWDNVLRAISLASSKLERICLSEERENAITDVIAEKASEFPNSTEPETEESRSRLPATLVRIPVEQRDKTGE